MQHGAEKQWATGQARSRATVHGAPEASEGTVGGTAGDMATAIRMPTASAWGHLATATATAHSHGGGDGARDGVGGSTTTTRTCVQ